MTSFEELAPKCNVKFRYSLLAGAAPFEWIARKQPKISSAQLSKWLDTQFKLVVKDVDAGRVRAKLESALPWIKSRPECLNKRLAARVRAWVHAVNGAHGGSLALGPLCLSPGIRCGHEERLLRTYRSMRERWLVDLCE